MKALPSNVTLTRGVTVQRYGVKIRFKGHALRIGSQYCSPEDAKRVVTVFRKAAYVDDLNNICFRPEYREIYKHLTVSLYLPFTVIKDTVPLVQNLDRWLEEWRRKREVRPARNLLRLDCRIRTAVQL